MLSDVFLRLFADDSKLFREIADFMTSKTLQDNLNAFVTWGNDWQISLNTEKCCVLHIGPNNENYSYYCNDVELVSKPAEKDLGFMLSVNLKCSDHIKYIVGKAYLKSNLIFKAFQCKDILFLTKMFTTFVRPILEYISPVWTPYLLKDIDCIESVQRSFTRRIPGLGSLNYVQRLVACGLEPLEVRRIRFDLICVFKIIHGLMDTNFDDYFEYSNLSTRGHGFKLRKPKCRTNVRQNFFSSRVVDLWNALPEDIVACKSLAAFKKKISDFNLNHACCGRTLIT